MAQFWLDTREAIMNSLKDKINEIEKEEIIRSCGWVMAKAARELGLTERMIGYKIKKYGIREEVDIWRANEFLQKTNH